MLELRRTEVIRALESGYTPCPSLRNGVHHGNDTVSLRANEKLDQASFCLEAVKFE